MAEIIISPAPSKMRRGSIIQQLGNLVEEMERGDYSEPSGATLITADKETGFLTISSMTEGGIDTTHELFRRMAAALGYARVN